MVAALIAAGYRRLIRIMHCRLRDRELAAELINEACVLALEHARCGRLKASESVPGYVLSVAANLLRNQRRDPDNRPELRAPEASLCGLSEVEEESPLDREQLKQWVRSVVAALDTARDREVVKRFYLDEDAKAVICEDMKLSRLGFDKVVFRARQRMKVLVTSLGFAKGEFFNWLL